LIADNKKDGSMRITDKLALDAFKNHKESHIRLDQKICHGCKERFCIYACPANLYSLNEKGEMVVEFAGCLECGTCMIACIYGSIQWTYPQSGFGVQYRCG
jgi:ferredoxin like protein